MAVWTAVVGTAAVTVMAGMFLAHFSTSKRVLMFCSMGVR